VSRAILLDVDGTLVDSNDLHAEAWQAALAEFDVRVPFDQVRRLIGMGSDKLLPALTQLTPDSPRGAEMVAARTRLFMTSYLPKVHAFPNARRFVERLLEVGHQPVVASSANGEELSGLLARANLTDLLPLTTTSDDAARSKPHPDIVQAALARANARAVDSIMLGDTPYDLVAAGRAGVPFVGVRSGGYDDYALRGSLAVYQDVAELVTRFDTSPFRLHSPMK
jgi:phosphoglycolate phosphatase-like HAD superfamily hydrolase